MKLKRITAALLAGVMCVGLLAGCGSKGDGDEKGSGDKITIRLLTRMAGTTAQVDIYNDILDEFKEKHPEVTIVDDSQGDESAFNNILSTDIASGTMANIFRIQGVANLSEYIDNRADPGCTAIFRRRSGMGRRIYRGSALLLSGAWKRRNLCDSDGIRADRSLLQQRFV